MRTVPLASVPLASMPQPKMVILASAAEVTVDSLPRRATKPRMTRDSATLLPRILETRTESGLTEGRPELLLLPMVPRQASTTRGARTSSLPYCLALRTGLTTLRRLFRSRGSSTVSTARAGRSSSSLSPAFLYPSTISLGCSPIRSRSSVWPSSSPAKLTVRLVPSPHSLSCASLAMESILAAGCSISSSRTMAAQSDVTMIRSRWLTTSLFMPLGPRDVETIRLRSRAASTLRTTVASGPDRCLWPDLSIPERPAAAFRFIDCAIFVMLGLAVWLGGAKRYAQNTVLY
mmetsp:Transcript_9245/g.21793  ORF Transcript_9245/g.21793 Transcript_9245/m.21793 type:complete len:290 (-) Transcript_9245:105-974(-)